jgi:glycolate oxidase
MDQGRIRFKKAPKVKVTYHDPCDLSRSIQMFEEPRNILRKIPGVELVEMKRNRLLTRCCGGGGGVQAHNPELAKEMAKERVMDALEVGAEMIVSSCVACKDNLKKGLRLIDREKRGNLKVIDITELISERMDK